MFAEMAFSNIAAKAANDVILSDPSTCDQWLENIGKRCLGISGNSLTPDSDAELAEPAPPVVSVLEKPPQPYETAGSPTNGCRRTKHSIPMCDPLYQSKASKT